MRTHRLASRTFAAFLAAFSITSCKDEILKVIEVSVVEVGGAPASLEAGTTAQLTAILKDDRGNRLSGRSVSWQTSSAAVATVSSSGLVTGVAPGAATITASSEGRSASVNLTVTPVPIASIVIEGATAGSPAPTSLQIGEAVQLTARALDAAGRPLTGRTITWATDNAGIATVTATGLVTGRAAGIVTIRASAEGVTRAHAMTVTAPVATVTVAPTSSIIDLGATLQLIATARDASGNVLSGRLITWATADPGIATVSTTGIVTGTGVGTVAITATAEGKSGVSVITVSASKIAMAYAYANQSATDSYTPPGVNLAGGTLQVTRTATGQYTVVFGGLGRGAGGFGNSFTLMVSGNSSNFLASLTAPTALCNLTLANVNVPVTANVRCEDPVTGADKDSRFRILVVGDNALAGTGAPGRQGAFSAHTNASQSANSPYAPPTAFSWNSGGGAMTVTWQGGGLFSHFHNLAIQSPAQGRLASAFGAGTVCYPQSQTATTTTVLCLNKAGVVNATHTVMTAFAGRPGKLAGYAHVDPVSGVWTGGSYNSSGGGFGFTKVGTGKFEITFPGISTSTQVAIVVNVQGGSAWYACNHFLAGSTPVTIEVACFDQSGGFADPLPAFSVYVVE